MKKSQYQYLPFFLLFIPGIFVMNNAVYYFGLLDWSLITPSLFFYFLASVGIYLLLRLVTRNWYKAGILTASSLLLFYFFQYLTDGLNSIGLESIARYRVLLPLLLILFAGLIFFLFRSQQDWSRWIRILNIATGLLFVAGIVQWSYLFYTGAEKRNEQADPAKTLSSAYTPCDTCVKPDIYYILLDGYTNNKTLQQEFGANIHAFESELDSLGFKVIPHSRSNYNFTHMSLSSVFNLQYLGHLDPSHRFSTKDFLQSYQTMRQNEWCRILRKEGYDISNFSIFDLEEAPVQVEPFLKELHYRSISGQTLFNKLNRDIGWQWRHKDGQRDLNAGDEIYAQTQLKRITETFDGVLKESRTKSSKPRFVYAHFLLPHETFYFDSTGKRKPLSHTINARLNKADYVSQLKYTNQFVLRPLINSILQYNERPAIIILQGDHGYRNYPLDKTDLEFENFNAIYFPLREKNLIPDHFSNVNTFRLISNTYFGKQFPYLKDSSINLMKSRTDQ